MMTLGPGGGVDPGRASAAAGEAEPSEDLVTAAAEDLGRTSDRLRSLAASRLARRGEDGSSLADAVHACCVEWAAEAALLDPERRREVPRLSDLAAGDQLAVVGADLLTVFARATAGKDRERRITQLRQRLRALRDLW